MNFIQKEEEVRIFTPIMILLDASVAGEFWDSSLARLDQQLFYLINGKWHNAVLDALLPYTRESIIWVPFYLFLFVFVWMNFGKKGLAWMLFALLTVALSDIISSGIIKEHIIRLRPCRDPNLLHPVRFLVRYCPQSSSFTSSHATNHFSAAMFAFITFRSFWKNAWWFFIWAGVISYAQVYVGVHFPFDILCGAIAGCCIGWLGGKLFNRQIGLNTFKFANWS